LSGLSWIQFDGIVRESHQLEVRKNMNDDVVIKVENVSKQYRLGLVGTGTISHDLNRWWSRLRGKEDPNLRIGETNDRAHKGVSEFVWALKDINFEVKRGEVLGIIGRNGAGKSTLLKILSRVTAPTTGEIKGKGRIASLLEVGTGFHPELTGRENIYLNGAINGMTKAEVTTKLDEIIDFSGCERYIDTPVKRYSSGMTVRLGFSVAAHLEAEILIVDEVLAVGDAEFQKKCMGKMKDVAGHGRTVLFVSHNLGAIRALCPQSLLLSEGGVMTRGPTDGVVDGYEGGFDETNPQSALCRAMGRDSDITGAQVTGFLLERSDGTPTGRLAFGEPFRFRIQYQCSPGESEVGKMDAHIGLYTEHDLHVMRFEMVGNELGKLGPTNTHSGSLICSVPCEGLALAPGRYYVNVALLQNGIVCDCLKRVLSFSVTSIPYTTTQIVPNSRGSAVVVKHFWQNECCCQLHAASE